MLCPGGGFALKVSTGTLRKIHMTLAVAWMFPGVPIAYWISFYWPAEVAAFAILVVSLWANSATHWGAYGAARAEQMADPDQPNPT